MLVPVRILRCSSQSPQQAMQPSGLKNVWRRQAGLPEDGTIGSPSYGLAVPPAPVLVPARVVRSFDETFVAAAVGRGALVGSGCALPAALRHPHHDCLQRPAGGRAGEAAPGAVSMRMRW